MGEAKMFDLQRRVVSHMVASSWMNVPHVSYLYEPDVTDFYQRYLQLGEGQEPPVSFNTLLLRVIVEGMKAAPVLNAAIRYHHAKGEGALQIQRHINISIPWTLPDGRMITPVLLEAESKSLAELTQAVQELEEKIKHTDVDELLYRAVWADTAEALKKFRLGVFRRILAAKLSFHRVKGLSGTAKKNYYRIPASRRLTAENLISGTVTVSNIGSLYKEQRGHFALLEIIPPQIFVVGLSAMQEKPGVFTDESGNKQIGIRKFLPMCLAFDHRAVDFSALVPFLQALDQVFDHPEIISGW